MSTPRYFWILGRRWILTAALACLVGGEAHAQLYSTDPYDPYGRAYRSFAYPNAGYNPSLPNASRFPQGPGSGASRANQFSTFGDDLGFDPFSGSSGRGSRYDSAFRRFDSDFGRDESPAEKSDTKFFEARERREQAMIQAMRERDPKKREKLVRAAEASAAKESDLGRSVRRGASSSSIPSAPTVRRRMPTSDRTTASSASRAPVAPVRPGSTPAARDRSGSAAPTASGATPPAPPVRSSRSPSDVLERNRRMDTQRGGTGSSSNPAPPPR